MGSKFGFGGWTWGLSEFEVWFVYFKEVQCSLYLNSEFDTNTNRKQNRDGSKVQGVPWNLAILLGKALKYKMLAAAAYMTVYLFAVLM